MGGISGGVKHVGSILQARSAIEQGEAEGKAAEYRRQVALNEAAAEETRIRRLGRRRLSKQFAIISASGAEVSGSALQFLADNAAELELEAVNARIRGLNVAKLERQAGRTAMKEGQRAAKASILSGIAGMLGSGSQMIPAKK
jgi:hypothetical protein